MLSQGLRLLLAYKQAHSNKDQQPLTIIHRLRIRGADNKGL